ncbi:MAG TPA: hypothetical protein VKX41_09025 [Alloacidobacterium sp.]|nr:hypothetical protein [Alloacidobacterium sp.]
MKKLSPADALGPAFRRLREVMAAPFRLGFFLKIAVVAALTQPGFYSVIISYPLQGVQMAAGTAIHRPGHMSLLASQGANSAFAGGAGTAVFLIFAIILLAGLAVWVLITYLFCRLRLTLFDMIVYRRGRVREAWSRYGRQTWRYFGVVLLASLAFLILLAATAGPFFVHMLKAAARVGAQGPNANPLPILGSMLPFLGVCLLIGLFWMVVDAVLQDFVLPPMAIEDAPIEGAFGRFMALLREDFGSTLIYLLLRFVVALGISWVLVLVVFMVLGAGGVAGAAVGFGLYRAMWPGGIGLRVVFIAIVAAMALVLLAIYLLAMIAVYGTVAVFKESYAAYFYGSRYPELGNLLEPLDEDLVGVRIEPPLPPMPPLSEPPSVW